MTTERPSLLNPLWDRVPHPTHGIFIGSTRVIDNIHGKRHVDWFSRFCMGPNCTAVQCIVNGGRKPPKTAPAPWDFVTLPEENRATARGDVRRRIGKDRACGSGDISSDRQTHTRAHTDVLITILCHRPSEQSDEGKLEMWANAQRDGRPAEYRWRSLFNAAKFG